MRLPIVFLLCASGVVGCAHEGRSASAPTTPRAEGPPLPYADTPLTPASGAGTPRAVISQPLVSTAPSDKAEGAADEQSISEIRAALASDKALAPLASQVSMVARDGRVWLRGQVNTPEQRAAIEKIARRASGVIEVKNALVVLE